jgi:hypothetical protein
MGLYVITEGVSSYNNDILLEAELTEEQFKEFDALMKSDKPFDLDGSVNQTPQDTEKIVKEAEKKMIASCKNHIESSEPTKSLPFLERIKHRLENSLSICEERINKVRNKKYDNESFTTKIKDQAIKFFNIIKKGIMKVLNAIVNFIIKVKNSIFKK